MSDNPKEREAFEAEFQPPHGVAWDGSAYTVNAEYINSYRCDRFVGQWAAWQARAAIEADRVRRDVPAATGKMTHQRAKFFMQRFMAEEKLLGPNEQAALAHVITLLEREQYASPQPQPVQEGQCETPRACQYEGCRGVCKVAQPVQAQPSGWQHTCHLTECQGRERCTPCIAMGMNAPANQQKD